MMNRDTWKLLILLITTAVIGCGGTGKPAANAGRPGEPEGQSVADGDAKAGEEGIEITENSTPEQVVVAFLESVRQGNKTNTTALLSSKAQTAISKEDLDVCPTASPDLSYQIGKTLIVSPKQATANYPSGAHVASVWTIKAPDGSSAAYDITWVLRQEEVGWRVAGFAAALNPGEEPQFLNFENPQEMLAKQGSAAAEGKETEEKTEPVQEAKAPTKGRKANRSR